MFQTSSVEKCLAGLVGFFQANDPAYPLIDNDLSSSASGLYVEGVHPLVTIENIVNIAPEFASFNYPAWSAKAYPTGARAKDNNVIYQALEPVISTDVTTGSKWRAVDPLSEWLRRVYNSACSNLALTISKQKKLESAGRSFLDSQALYSGWGQLTDRIVKRSRFVGFEISPRAEDGLVLTIPKFAIQLDTAQTFDLYLYNSSQIDPVRVFPITVVKANSFAWVDLTEAVIAYMQGGADVGSSWYLGYYEDDLQGQAIERSNDLTRAPCSTCNRFDIDAYNRWSPYMQIAPFYVDDTYLDTGKQLFDHAGIRYMNNTNYGINLTVTVTCDITDIFCRNRSIIANALRMQIVTDLLNCIAYSTRINAISDITKAKAKGDLSIKPGATTFMNRYLDEVRTANIDFSGISRNCLPCNDSNLIHKRTI